MAHQTDVVRTEESTPPPIVDISDGLASVASDLMRLADLQARILAIDLKKSSNQTKTGVMLIAAGALGIGGASAVGLAALGSALMHAWGLSLGTGLSIAAAVGIGIGAALVLGGLSALRVTLGIFHRSGTEFRRNLDGIKRSVSGSIN